MTVDFATYCCGKDADRLQKAFTDHLISHNYEFNKVHIVYQRTPVIPIGPENTNRVQIKEEDYDAILAYAGINPDNQQAEEYTHGWTHSHYWKHHCVNHLTVLRESQADYIVFCDADCYMVNKTNWIDRGIDLLDKNPHLLVISPSDGGGEGVTQNMSQQLFLCKRSKLAGIDFDLPFTGFRDGGPMQEYYFMLEGRIGRYMEQNGLYRYMLGSIYRYWHDQWH